MRTIELEEKYGGKTYQAQKAKDDKKRLEKTKAAIGFTYTDSTGDDQTSSAAKPVPDNLKQGTAHFQDPRVQPQGGGDSDSEIDLDMTVDLMSLGVAAQIDLNSAGKAYNLGKDDFVRFLARDIEEQEELKAAKQQEEEKAMFTVSTHSAATVRRH